MLKGLRALYIQDIQYISEAAMEQGTFCIVKATQPSGAGVGAGINSNAPVAVAPPSGGPLAGAKPAGLLIDSVVDYDTTQVHQNFHKTQQRIGENVCLLKDGWVFTNLVNGTPAVGDKAYIGGFGKLQNTAVNSGEAVGVFQTSKDSDGYCRVAIKIA